MPTREEVAELFASVRPRLVRLLCRSEVPPEVAQKLLEEAALALLDRWGRISHRDWWLLDRLNRSLRRHALNPLPRSPDNEEKEGSRS